MDKHLLEQLKKMIAESNNIVVLGGVRMEEECGINSVRMENVAYEVEQRYGYSPEEILTPSFLQNRVELFYDYFKRYVIQLDKMLPGEAHVAVMRLEQSGRLQAIITRSPFGLYQMLGSRKVIELHGSIHKYVCPKCKKEYSDVYVASSNGIPYCQNCKVALRPDLALYGEELNNTRISKAAEFVEKADVLLVLGASLNSYLTKHLLKYYSGNKLIMINDKSCINDDKADYVVYGRCSEILPQIM